MFRNARKRLTILFTIVSGSILFVMTLLYLYLTTRDLLEREYSLFVSNMNTYVANCENRLVISNSSLAKMRNNQQYSLFLYDNDIPFLFNTASQSESEQKLADTLLDQYQEQIHVYTEKNPLSTYHIDFSYRSSDGTRYYVGIGYIPRESGFLTMVVLYPLNSVYHRLSLLYLQAFGIVIFTCALLCLFCYHYTGHLLTPLEENQRRQTQFIAAASHELRTPVAAVMSSLSAAKIANTDEQMQFIDASLIESKRLSQLVNDLLTLARSDGNRMLLNIQSSEPDTLLLEVYEAYLAMAHEHKLTFKITLPEEAVTPVPFDHDRIFQVLAILIHNAISYTPAEGTICLSLENRNHHCTFIVADNGCGISKEDQLHLFERFYRGDQSRSKSMESDSSHFGLGLSIAKEIVNAHKGNITFYETKGGGTTFAVSL